MSELVGTSSIVSFISDESTGIMVEVHADPRTRRVHWMSDWCLCDKLDSMGLLTHIHYGPGSYGHVDFFLPPS